MRILIDGDACPSRDIIEKVAKEYDIKVIIFCDFSHNIKSQYSEICCIEGGFQSVDMYLVNKTLKGDIVVSADYGLCAMALGKKAYCISPNGFIYNDENIDRLLFERHIASSARRSGVRRSGVRMKGPKKRSACDEQKLQENLRKLIKNHL